MERLGPQQPRGPRRWQPDAEDYVPRKKMTGQRQVDFFSPAIKHVQTRLYHSNSPYDYHVPPHPFYDKDLIPARQTPFNPSAALCTQWVTTSFHPDTRTSRVRVPLCSLQWSPNGRRLLCSTGRGEFLLFNGYSFGVEVKTVAHEDHRPCRAIAWGPKTDLIVSGDDAGVVKMWLSSLVFVAEFNTNHRAVREITWSPFEEKFCTAGQDGSARVWDTNAVGSNPKSAHEEVKLEGHGGDVTTVNWHPFNSLIVTGSQDKDCRLWDPRTASRGSIAAFHGHGQPISAVRWNQNGHTLLTASKDATVKLWDIRSAQEVISFEGHTKSVEKIEWHPSVPDLFVSVGADGRILYWTADGSNGTPRQDGVLITTNEVAAIDNAHDKFRDVPNAVASVAWSPLGHILATCANEVKYWHRAKPGAMEEKERNVEEDVLDEGHRLTDAQ